MRQIDFGLMGDYPQSLNIELAQLGEKYGFHSVWCAEENPAPVFHRRSASCKKNKRAVCRTAGKFPPGRFYRPVEPGASAFRPKQPFLKLIEKLQGPGIAHAAQYFFRQGLPEIHAFVLPRYFIVPH